MNKPKPGYYCNLKAELARQGVSQHEVAQFLGIADKSMSAKMRGRTPFKANELVRIRDEFAPDATLDYLLATK